MADVMLTEMTSSRPLRGRVRLAFTALFAGALISCGDPTGLDGVTFDLDLVPAFGLDSTATYHFTLRNTTSLTIYLPACAAVVLPAPRITGPGNVRDQLSQWCPANMSMVPVAVAP